MPVIVAWIGRMLLTVAGEALIKGVVGASIGVASYTLVVTPVRAYMMQRFAAAGDFSAYVGFLGIDVAVTIVLSALGGRAAINSSKAYFTKRVK